MAYSSSRPPTLSCQDCGGPLRRVHRRRQDRGAHVPAALRRYRCRNLTCVWEGLVDRDVAEGTTPIGHAVVLPTPLNAPITSHKTRAAFLPRRVRKAAVSLSLLGLGALAATAMHFWPADVDPHWPRTARGQLIALGESYDGDDLVDKHPLNQSPLPDATGPTLDAPVGKSVPAHRLALRQHCTWGQPGRSPYRGTVQEALRAAQLPEVVVQKVAAQVGAHDSAGRLVINNKSIRLVGSKRQFSAANVTMTYGRTLCVETKVHFKRGHRELADLYEASDDKGQRYAVMVPDVCGNVSVLAASEDAAEEATLSASGAQGSDINAAQAVLGAAGGEIPEPGTLAVVLLGLAALILRWGRRP